MDNDLEQELQALENWFRGYRDPRPDPAAVQRVRAAVRAQAEAGRRHAPAVADAARDRIKRAVVRELAHQVRDRRPAGFGRWLAAAAMVGFAIGVVGVLDYAGRFNSPLQELQFVETSDSELVDIEVGILQLERRSAVRDFLMAGPEDDLRDMAAVESLSAPSYVMDFVDLLQGEGV